MTPVGDKVADLKPEIWNGKWLSGEGDTGRTKIKDAKRGIVEMTTRQGSPTLIHGKWEVIPTSTRKEIFVRDLGSLTIANESTDDPHEPGYNFARISIDATHLVVFYPDESIFRDLVKRHKLAGEFEKDEHGKPTGYCILDHFSDKDYQRLKNDGFDVRSLFNEDPVTVLVRYRWRLFW